MAKVSAPLLSLEASGTIAGCLTFQARKTGAVAHSTNRHSDRKSPPQLRNRHIMYTLRTFWHNLPQSVKDYWNNAAASHPGMSGYNLYIKTYFDQYFA